MPEYLLSGTGPDGRRTTERVDADSAEEALADLGGRGFSDIVLHTDEVQAAIGGHARVADSVSPAEYVALGRSGPVGRWLIRARRVVTDNWLILLLAGGLFVARRLTGDPLGFVDLLCLIGLAVPFVFPTIGSLLTGLAGMLPGAAGAEEYARLTRAGAHARWDEVLERLPRLSGQAPAFDLAFWRGRALAATGRLDEGLRVVAPYANGRRIPEWMYWSLVAELYGFAKRHDDQIAAHERACELSPDNATVRLDLGLTLVRYRGDTRRGRQMLEAAKALPVSDTTRFAVSWLEGVLALESGEAAAAREHLERALAEMGPVRASPLSMPMDARLRASLAVALARLGETAAGLREFRRGEAFLRAHQSDDLIARCERELGLPSTTGDAAG
jgi:Flp pilus assembly protein TadD